MNAIPEKEQIKIPLSPILVTGAHRTGTTWVGKMLAASQEAAYISEPFNVWHRPGVLSVPVQHWYTYICAENEAEYLPALLEMLSFRYHTWAEIRSLRSRKDTLRMGRDWSIFLTGKLRRQRPLLKDPFAVFSAPWFAERLGCQVVITVRHPAAFASSLRRLDWPFEFKDFLAQPLLVRDWLQPFHDEMEEMERNPGDILGQSSLLWKIIYHVVSIFRERYSSIQIVRHEDLSLDPVEGYRLLYHSLGLTFTPLTQKAILGASKAANPQELSKKAIHGYRIDSRANLQNWKKRLKPEDIERIRNLTGEVAARFYPDLEWE